MESSTKPKPIRTLRSFFAFAASQALDVRNQNRVVQSQIQIREGGGHTEGANVCSIGWLGLRKIQLELRYIREATTESARRLK
jgi:hypothetical protein